jgi:hypothetical protein
MGAKNWMLVLGPSNLKERLAQYPPLDREAAAAAAARLFPRVKTSPIEDGTLSWTNPPDDELYVGVFDGVTVVAAKEFGIDQPSKLDPHFVRGHETAVLHAMHSVVDWFAMAKWNNGTLERALSLSPDSGVLEDFGGKLQFEVPYWDGEHPAVDPEDEDEDMPYPFPFHPLDLGEAALRALFGYQLEGYMDESLLDTERFALLRFKRKKSFFGF